MSFLKASFEVEFCTRMGMRFRTYPHRHLPRSHPILEKLISIPPYTLTAFPHPNAHNTDPILTRFP